MEWRIFIPLLNETNSSSIGFQNFTAYVELQQKALTEIVNEDLSELRDDTYVIGRSHFGLKARAGNKAELKIRLNCGQFGVENWVKHKLGNPKTYLF